MLSLGWLVGKLKHRFGDGLLLSGFSLAMTAEVALITMQQWRGVPSHFNRATDFDSAVLFGVESLILFATIVICELTRRCFQDHVTNASDMRLAIRGGMSLLVFACLLGFVLVAYGNSRMAVDADPGIYGKAGVMKFPHGVPIHAIQFLPALAWCLRRFDIGEEDRRFAVGCSLISIVSFTAFSLLQTFSGRSRFDVMWTSGLLLLISVVLVVAPLLRLSLLALPGRKNGRSH